MYSHNSIVTINPYTKAVIKKYNYASETDIAKALKKADDRFNTWKRESISSRTVFLNKLSKQLKLQKKYLGELITSEMGKPISESYQEIEKCILLCDFYSKNAEDFLADVVIKTEAQESFISYDPLGCILGIMPWNFPFWQVFRFAIPTLIAGNTIILKHASNTTGCALEIEKLFNESGFPEGCLTTLLANHNSVETIIKDHTIKGVSLTGSEFAGKKIAALAGAELKPTLLELGGNNACIVLKDANLDKYMDIIVKARMQNTGQSCIAAKRFIVEEKIYDEFLEKFSNAIASLRIGNPFLKDTEISVMAREDLADELEIQVNKSLDMGAYLHYGNNKKGAYYQPTILTQITYDMPVFKEETFGPVAAVIKVPNKEEAFKAASTTKFGLGTMLITENIEAAKHQAIDILDGAFFINEMVKSHPELPFGGTKTSGYGRELSKEGILAFTNKKTIYIK